MQQYLQQGATMRVCGGAKEIHGFELDELVRIVMVRPEPELSHVALCENVIGTNRAVMMVEELEDL